MRFVKRRFKIPNTWDGIINWTSLKWEVESIQGRHENGTEEETLIAASFWLYSAGLSKNVDGENNSCEDVALLVSHIR